MRNRLLRSVIFIFLLCTISLHAKTRIFPQLGFEYYSGPNQLLSFRPWFGLRLGLSTTSSVIVKYSLQSISYLYPTWDESEIEIDKKISHLTAVYYFQKDKYEYYGAISYLTGTELYDGFCIDAGGSVQVIPLLKLNAGIYILSENSTLWFPDEEIRYLALYSLRIGAQIKINSKLFFDPKIYLSRNSEDVRAFSYAIGFVYSPIYPLYFNLYFSHYSETDLYKFSGDYLIAGINLYF